MSSARREARRPQRLARKNTVKNLAEAVDSFVRSGVEELPEVGRQDALRLLG